jgi:hypothetical protein
MSNDHSFRHRPILCARLAVGVLVTMVTSGCQSRGSAPGNTNELIDDSPISSSRVDAPSSPAPPPASAAQRSAGDGTFINHISKEINTKILVLSAQGTRPRQFAQYVHSKVPPADRTDLVDLPPAGDKAELPATAYQMFSFIPEGLGEIRGYRVRIHVGALCGPTTPADLDSAILGSGSIILVVSNDASEYTGLIDRVTASPAYSKSTPVVLFVEDARLSSPTPAKVAPVSVIMRTSPGDQADFFPVLKPAVKLALERLKEPSPPNDEPVQPVALVPLVDVLRALERKNGRPLTEAEVRDVRDHATFIALTPSNAKALAQRRGYADLDPERIWEEWQARRSKR